MENKLRVAGGVGGGGGAKWVRGIKKSTPEITVALYANLDVNFKKIKNIVILRPSHCTTKYLSKK